MNNQKIIDLEMPYVIYGAGKCGERYAESLIKAGKKVIGFLDKYQQGTSRQQLPIQRLGEENYDKENVVILISLANGNLHCRVAAELADRGYEYLLFLPLELPIPYSIKSRLLCLYNEVTAGKKENFLLDPYQSYEDLLYDENDCLLKISEDEMVVWIGQELLFTEVYEDYPGDKSMLPQVEGWYNNPLVARRGYFALFQYLGGREANLDEYFQLFPQMRSDEEKGRVLAERGHLYHTYLREVQRGNLQFFIDTAPMGAWNEKGYFNLIGGHHRTIFFASAGYDGCPLKIKRTDYEKWKNEEVLERLKAVIKHEDIVQCKVSIPHPAFSNWIPIKQIDTVKLLRRVTEFLYEHKEECRSVLDLSCWDGYFSRLAARLGIKNVKCVVETKRCTFVSLLNELLYCSKVDMVSNDGYCIDEKFDFVFIADRTARYKSEDQLEKLILDLNEVTEKYMLWQSDSPEEIQYILQHTKFNKYTAWQRDCEEGRIMETGVFEK